MRKVGSFPKQFHYMTADRFMDIFMLLRLNEMSL